MPNIQQHSSSEDNDAERRPRPNFDDITHKNVRCIYCLRKNCQGCPLPFEDKQTLREFLQRKKAPLQSVHHYYEDDCFNNKMSPLCKGKMKSAQKGKDSILEQEKGPEFVDDQDNFEFEIIVSFNKNFCWGMYELLIRGQNQKSNFVSYIQKLKKAKSETLQFLNGEESNSLEIKNDPKFFIDKVTISDCFRQFDRPEKLSFQNEWYCDQCKQHKQAFKKIQVFKTPPVLIITLKRFKG